MTYISKKNSDGQYEKVKTPEPEPLSLRTDVSIDSLLNKGLLAIERTMKNLATKSCGPGLEREDVMNLKDLMVMLSDLKEKEQDVLESMSDEELKKYE
jgi:hypothetical protein